jgi:hypothetical protein
MTAEERVEALRPFGFTARQTRFLEFVMTHSGVCLQRQYTAFASIVHGEKTRRFFAKLVHLGLVSTYECAHNRARIYHVRHKALYQAIGAPDHRHRRPVPLPRAIERLMMLDAVLAHRGATLLTEAEEKVSHLETLAGVPRELMPRAMTAAGPQLFPDRLPIAVYPDGRVVFVHLMGATQPTATYSFIYRHVAMLDRLPHWTMQFVLPAHAADWRERYEQDLRECLHWPFRRTSVGEVRNYFKQRRALELQRSRTVEFEHFVSFREAHDAHRYEALYTFWKSEGDAILDTLDAPRISRAIATGSGRVEAVVLPHNYTHLSPLAAFA